MSRQEIVLHLLSLLNRKIQLSANVIKFISFIKLLNLTALLTLYKKNTWFKLHERKISKNYPGLSFLCSNSCYLLGKSFFYFTTLDAAFSTLEMTALKLTPVLQLVPTAIDSYCKEYIEQQLLWLYLVPYFYSDL